jgi:MATE family multidrug resistance protein
LLFGVLSLPLFWFSGADPAGAGPGAAGGRRWQLYLRIAGLGILPAVLAIVLRSHLSALERPRVVLWAWLGGAALNAGTELGADLRQSGRARAGDRGGRLRLARDAYPDPAGARRLRGAGKGPVEYALFERFWRSDWPVFFDVFRLGWPIGLTLLAESGLFVGTMVMMGWIGTTELAASGIALQIISVTFMVHIGLSSAATVRAGHAWGRGDRANLRQAAVAALVPVGGNGGADHRAADRVSRGTGWPVRGARRSAAPGHRGCWGRSC